MSYRDYKIARIEAHLKGFDPETGEQYEVEPIEMIQPPPTIGEIIELVKNGQPINGLIHNEGVFDDEEGPSDDEDKEFFKLDELSKGVVTYDDPLIALDYAKSMMSDKEYQKFLQEQKKPSPEQSPEHSPEPSSEPSPELEKK